MTTDSFDDALTNLDTDMKKSHDHSELLSLIKKDKDKIKPLLQADATACNILLDSISDITCLKTKMAVLDILGDEDIIIDSLPKGKGEASDTPLDHILNFHMAMGDAYYQVRNPEDAYIHYQRAMNTCVLNSEQEGKISAQIVRIKNIGSLELKLQNILCITPQVESGYILLSTYIKKEFQDISTKMVKLEYLMLEEKYQEAIIGYKTFITQLESIGIDTFSTTYLKGIINEKIYNCHISLSNDIQLYIPLINSYNGNIHLIGALEDDMSESIPNYNINMDGTQKILFLQNIQAKRLLHKDLIETQIRLLGHILSISVLDAEERRIYYSAKQQKYEEILSGLQ